MVLNRILSVEINYFISQDQRMYEELIQTWRRVTYQMSTNTQCVAITLPDSKYSEYIVNMQLTWHTRKPNISQYPEICNFLQFFFQHQKRHGRTTRTSFRALSLSFPRRNFADSWKKKRRKTPTTASRLSSKNLHLTRPHTT